MSRTDAKAVLGVAGLCAIVVIAGIVCVTVLGGCGGASSATRSAALRPSGSASAEQTASAPETQAAVSGASDMESVDAELDAMQKELDRMSMPSDSDFNAAVEDLF